MPGPGNAFDLSPDMAELRRRITALEGVNARITTLETQVAALKKATTVGVTSTVNVSGITVHGQLSGLSADDHPQYYNATRGDARYAPLAVQAEVNNTHSLTAWGASLSFNFSATNTFGTISDWQGMLFGFIASLATAKQRVVTTDVSIDPITDDVLFVDCSGGNRIITLPAVAAWIVTGNTLLIRRPVSVCRTDTSGNTLTLTAAGGETVTDLAGSTGATASILVGECWTGTINTGNPTTATGWRPI